MITKTQPKRGLKYKIGMFFLILMVISPLLGLAIPYLNLEQSITLTIQGFLIVGGPEVFMIIGVAFAGKEGLETVKNTVKKMLGLPQGNYTATKSQYNLGLVMVFLGLFTQLMIAYLPQIPRLGSLSAYSMYVNLLGDVLIIGGVFTAGQQFVTKLKNLITWETWALESKPVKK